MPVLSNQYISYVYS